MAMAWLWTGMVAVSLVFGILTGSVGELGGAALEGATAAVELCVSMAGIMCLWTGVMEVMDQCGLSAALARLFRPLLRRLLPWCGDACPPETKDFLFGLAAWLRIGIPENVLPRSGGNGENL